MPYDYEDPDGWLHERRTGRDPWAIAGWALGLMLLGLLVYTLFFYGRA